jgi:hypothetical protein
MGFSKNKFFKKQMQGDADPLKPSINATLCQSPNVMWNWMTNDKAHQCIK